MARNNMSMLSTFHSRKPNHEDTQKFDENEVYKIQVKLADPAAVQQFNADMAMVGIDMTKAWNHWLITDCHWDAAAKLLAVLKNMPEIEAGPEYHGVRWKHGDVQASMRGNFIRFEGDPKAMIDKISAALSARPQPNECAEQGVSRATPTRCDGHRVTRSRAPTRSQAAICDGHRATCSRWRAFGQLEH